MKIKVKTQYNELGGEYLNQGEDLIILNRYRTPDADEIILTIDGTQYEIPTEVFIGLLNK